MQKINFLDRDLNVSWALNRSLYKDLVYIHKEDFETKKERYQLMLGNWEAINTHSVIIYIEAVSQFSLSIKNYEIDGIPIVDYFKEYSDSELSQTTLIGCIHTHPIKQKDLASTQSSWYPYAEERNSLIDCYQKGHLDSNWPFLFCVAGGMSDYSTVYEFYRVIKNNKKYFVSMVERQ